MVHLGAAGQLRFKAGKRWRGFPLARCVGDVVTQEADREGAAPTIAPDTARGVQGEHVEEHGVAWGEVPAEDIPGAAIGLDIRQIRQAAFREPLRLAVEEAAWHQPRPKVRAPHELKGGRS